MSLLYSVKLLFAFLIFIFTLSFVGLPAILLLLRWKFTSERQRNKSNKLKVAFFHPYCNAGGGGEKVLWVGLQELQKRYSNFSNYYNYCYILSR